MRRFLASVALALFAGIAPAKSLYVNNSGTPACSDATTYAANDAASPWCTIGRAAWGSTSYSSPSSGQAATAGDTVNVTAGTYTTAGNTSPTGCRWLVALNPANSGTSGSLLTFIGIGAVNVRLASGSYGPTIGVDNRDYVVWDNFRIDESAAAGESCGDTGPVLLHDTTGSKIRNSVIRGTYRSWSDNYNGIRLEAVWDGSISNNEIYDITCNFGTNCAGLMLYDVKNTVMEHNYIHGNATAIYVKGDHVAPGDVQPDQEDNTIRFNWIESNTSVGLHLYSARRTLIYQNIIKNSEINVRLLGDTANSGVKIVNNLIVTSAADAYAFTLENGDTTLLTGMQFFNNICYGNFGECRNFGGNPIGGTSSEHNVYYGYSVFGSVSGATRTFATWQGTYAQDTVSPAGVNSDPMFVNETLYKLQGGSPAKNIGVDILDLDGDSSTTDNIDAGPYVTGSEVIGITGGSLLLGPTNPRWRPRASLWYWLMMAGWH